jgi:exonuclease III
VQRGGGDAAHTARVVSWNVNGLRRIAPGGLKAFLADALPGVQDVLCVQETKLLRQDLTRELALADGWCVRRRRWLLAVLVPLPARPPPACSIFISYHCADQPMLAPAPAAAPGTGRDAYFAFSRGKVGYSGVATFCRHGSALPLPLHAEEGLTGALPQPSAAAPKRHGGEGGAAPAPALPLPDWDAAGFGAEELQQLDSEGRCVITDHVRAAMQTVDAAALAPPGRGATRGCRLQHARSELLPGSTLHRTAVLPRHTPLISTCVFVSQGFVVVFNVYVPAITSEERAVERFAFKLRFLTVRPSSSRLPPGRTTLRSQARPPATAVTVGCASTALRRAGGCALSLGTQQRLLPHVARSSSPRRCSCGLRCCSPRAGAWCWWAT